eukprot:12927974-Prorocentrum_lima.AAC.1
MGELREKFPYDEESQTLGRVEVFEDCIRGEQEGLQHFTPRYEAAVRGMHREGIDLPMKYVTLRFFKRLEMQPVLKSM